MTQTEHAKKVHELAKIKELTVKNLEELLKFDITDCYDENDYYSDGKYGKKLHEPLCSKNITMSSRTDILMITERLMRTETPFPEAISLGTNAASTIIAAMQMTS